MKNRRLIGVDENGYRVGESHHHAKLTDVQVEQIRLLYEEGFIGYRTLARWFNVPRSTISGICRYRRRVGVLAAFKEATEGGKAKGNRHRAFWLESEFSFSEHLDKRCRYDG